MKNWQKLALTSLLLFVLQACTKPTIQKARYVEPNWFAPSETAKTLDIFVTSKTFDQLESKQAVYYDNSKAPVKFGGAKLLLSYRDIAKKRETTPQLWLDLGNNCDPKSDVVHQQIVLHLLNRMNLDAAVFSSNELAQIGIAPRKDFSIPYVNSHLIDLAAAKSFENEMIKPWRIIEKNNIKVGIIAITYFEKLKENQNDKTLGLYFEDMVLGILRVKKEFEKEKVNATVLMAQIPSSCSAQNDSLACSNDNDALKQILLRLPPNAVDLVVTNSDQIESGKLNHYSIVNVPAGGRWIARAQIKLEKDTESRPEVALMQPLRVCNTFYHDTEDCHVPSSKEPDTSERTLALKKSEKEMKPAKFWGHEITEDQNLDSEIQTIRTQGTLNHSNNE